MIEEIKLILLVGGHHLPDECYSFLDTYNNTFIKGHRISVIMCTKSDISAEWSGILGTADVIVNYGDWSPSKDRSRCKKVPIITWSGDDKETMTRIMAYL